MDSIKIALNLRKPGNYAFFCPTSRLHLTLSNPAAYVDRVTSSILNGIRYGTLVDVDGVIDTSTGEIRQHSSAALENMPGTEPLKEESSVQKEKKKAGRKKGTKKEVSEPAEESVKTEEPVSETIQEETPVTETVQEKITEEVSVPEQEETAF